MALNEGAPGEEAGQGEGSQKEFDYKVGYEQLRPEYTRTTQELSSAAERLSEYEEMFDALDNPETRAAALDALGFELDTGVEAGSQREQEEEFIDPLEARLDAAEARVQELEQSHELEATNRENENIIALRDDLIGEEITAIEDHLAKSQEGFKFTPEEDEVLGNLAIAMEDDEGLPDVRSAYAALYGDTGVLEINRERWISTKTGAGRAASGRSAASTKKPTTRQGRVEYFDERLRAQDDQR